MHTPLSRVLSPFVLAVSLFAAAPAGADETIQHNIPGGDGKELMDSPRDPDAPTGAIIRDDECAKKTMKGKTLNTGQPNPEYEKCVRAKVEKTKKSGKH